MKAVVTDGHALNPGDLKWDGLKELAETEIFDRTDAKEIVTRCADAGIVLTNKVAFGREEIEKLPALKLICVLATGYDIIDIEAAQEKGIVVCNVPDYGTDSVAQHTFALILELVNQVGLHSRSVASGEWQKSPDFSYALSPLIELKGKTLGLAGFGNIGRRVAKIAGAFGMRVIYYAPHKKETDLAEYADLETIFRESDIVSLHLPLKPDNAGFVNADLLKKMKSRAFLVNTSRGLLIDEHALAAALNNNIIAGAATDVLSEEPPRSNPLLTAKNCIITPHNAWMSFEARQRIMDITLRNVRGFITGNMINVVS